MSLGRLVPETACRFQVGSGGQGYLDRWQGRLRWVSPRLVPVVIVVAVLTVIVVAVVIAVLAVMMPLIVRTGRQGQRAEESGEQREDCDGIQRGAVSVHARCPKLRDTGDDPT